MTPEQHIAEIREFQPKWHTSAHALCDAYEALAERCEQLADALTRVLDHRAEDGSPMSCPRCVEAATAALLAWEKVSGG